MFLLGQVDNFHALAEQELGKAVISLDAGNE